MVEIARTPTPRANYVVKKTSFVQFSAAEINVFQQKLTPQAPLIRHVLLVLMPEHARLSHAYERSFDAPVVAAIADSQTVADLEYDIRLPLAGTAGRFSALGRDDYANAAGGECEHAGFR